MSEGREGEGYNGQKITRRYRNDFYTFDNTE